jgi:hypothetical protein
MVKIPIVRNETAADDLLGRFLRAHDKSRMASDYLSLNQLHGAPLKRWMKQKVRARLILRQSASLALLAEEHL